VVPVPDLEVVDLMTGLHRGLVAGQTMSTALAAAQHDLRQQHGDGHRLLAAAAFVCFGAG
jgi:hypothetical protein